MALFNRGTITVTGGDEEILRIDAYSTILNTQPRLQIEKLRFAPDFRKEYALLPAEPMQYNRIAKGETLDDFSVIQPGNWVKWGASIFKVITSSVNELTAEHRFQDNYGNVSRKQEYKYGTSYIWDLKVHEKPHLQKDGLEQFRHLSDREVEAVEFMYLTTKGVENRSVSSQLYVADDEIRRYPIRWTRHMWYNIKFLDGPDNKDRLPFRIDVIGVITRNDQLKFQPTGSRCRTLVMSGTGLIFELTAFGPNLVAVFDGDNVTVERVKSSPYIWCLEFDEPARLARSLQTAELSGMEFRAVNELVACTPVSEKSQLFAEGEGVPNEKHQVEDSPATALFGPHGSWNGLFSRRGRDYIQISHPDGNAERYELALSQNGSDKQNCWMAAKFVAGFWIPEPKSDMFTWKRTGSDISVSRADKIAVRFYNAALGRFDEPIDKSQQECDLYTDCSSSDEPEEGSRRKTGSESAVTKSGHRSETDAAKTRQAAATYKIVGNGLNEKQGTSMTISITAIRKEETQLKRGAYKPVAYLDGKQVETGNDQSDKRGHPSTSGYVAEQSANPVRKTSKKLAKVKTFHPLDYLTSISAFRLFVQV